MSDDVRMIAQQQRQREQQLSNVVRIYCKTILKKDIRHILLRYGSKNQKRNSKNLAVGTLGIFLIAKNCFIINVEQSIFDQLWTSFYFLKKFLKSGTLLKNFF